MQRHLPSPTRLVLFFVSVPLLVGGTDRCKPLRTDPNPGHAAESIDSDRERSARESMVREQIAARGVRDARVLAAMRDRTADW